MPILDIQRRLTQLGVIRLGRQVPTGKTNAKGDPTFRPEKLDRFRITSPDRAVIDAVAATYGGTVAAWRGPSGPEWEVITETKTLPVLVPPQKIDPNYELWGKGFKVRVCDGGTERLRNAPCLCVQGGDDHEHDFVYGGQCDCGAKRECKPTTRLSLMLAEIPGLGAWKLESHGRNAAAELPMTSDALEAAPGPVPAMLVVQYVEKKILMNAGRANEKVEPRSFYVPRLLFNFVTSTQWFGGQLGSAAHAALTGGEQRPAIAATPEPDASEARAPKHSPNQIFALAKLCKNVEQLQQLWRDAATEGVLTDEVKAVLTARSKGLSDTTAAPAGDTAAEPAADVVDAEVEPDRDTTWFAIVGEAGKRGWDQPTVETKYRDRMRHDPSDDAATGWKLGEFLTALKNGKVN